MKFERFIARRYLFSGKKKASFSAITAISILGVALGVYALIVVIAVMDGFDRNLVEKFVGSSAHVTITRAWVGAPPLDPEVLLPKIRQVPGVLAASPVVQQLALLQVSDERYGQRQAGLMINGVDFESEPQVTNLMSNVLVGNARPTTAGLVLGKQIAQDQLFAPVDQRMLLVTTNFKETPEGKQPLLRNVYLAGVFSTGFPESDEFMAYTSIQEARRLLGLPRNHVDAIRVSAKSLDDVEKVTAAIQAVLGRDYRATSWLETKKMLFDALRLEKWAMFIILLLVVLIAAFNIIGILTMIVLEKTREIGILKSMGATEGSILRVFLNQGLGIGGAGIVLGGVGGLLTCYILDRYVRLPITSAWLSDKIPILVTPWTVLLILGSSLAIVLLASLIPARQAARLDPVEALRYE